MRQPPILSYHKVNSLIFSYHTTNSAILSYHLVYYKVSTVFFINRVVFVVKP